jgi:hypothetical protein
MIAQPNSDSSTAENTTRHAPANNIPTLNRFIVTEDTRETRNSRDDNGDCVESDFVLREVHIVAFVLVFYVLGVLGIPTLQAIVLQTSTNADKKRHYRNPKR